MSILHVQDLQGQHGTATPFTSTAFTNPTVTHNSLFIALGSDDTAPPAAAITDNKTNVFTQIIAIAGGDFNWCSLYYCADIIGGSGHTITGATGNSGDHIFICGMEFSGLSATVDKQTSLHTPVGTVCSTGTTGVTTQNDELAIAIAADDVGTNKTSSYTGVINSVIAANVGLSMSYSILTSTGAQSATFTQVSCDMAAAIACIKGQAAFNPALGMMALL